jgi:beta-mannosidase
VTWSVLDHTRAPKAAWQALMDACAPVAVIADRPAARYAPGERLSLNVHVVNDLRVALEDGFVDAQLSWPGGERSWRFAGAVPADSCVRVGRVDAVLDGVAPGEVRLDISLRRSGAGPVRSSYAAAFDVLGKGATAAH